MGTYVKSILQSFLAVFILIVVSPSSAATTSLDHLNLLVFSDIHLNSTKTVPMEIYPRKTSATNDLDSSTFDWMLQKIQSAINDGTIQKPNFILLLGDLAGHENFHFDDIYNDENIVLQQVQRTFHDIPIFMIFGNNDSLEKDYGMFYYPAGVKGLHSPYEVAMANGWLDGFLSTGQQCSTTENKTYPCILNEDNINGYYTAYMAPQLRLIALSSNMFSASKHNTSLQPAADQQLDWIKQQLQEARLEHDAVIIASHIPVGNNIFDHSSFWRDIDQTPFYKLLSEYKSNIIGMLVGHTHMEELKILKDTANTIVGTLVYTPGLSTSHGNAPAVKTFYVTKNSKKWSLANYETFYFAKNENDDFSVKKLYNFIDYYCSSKPGVNNIFDCLSYVNIDKLQTYYTAANPNYFGTIGSPADLFITLPSDSNAATANSTNKNNYGIYGVIGAAALVGGGVLLLKGTSTSYGGEE